MSDKSNTPQRDNGFSLHRLAAFASYYFPQLKRQIFAYLLISILLSALIFVSNKYEVQMALYSVTWSVLGILCLCAPLIFAKKGNSRVIERLIPVSAAEKTVFYFLYLLVAIPVILFLAPSVAMYILIHNPGLISDQLNEILKLSDLISESSRLTNVVSSVGAIATCFYFVMRARHNRMLVGIVSIIVLEIVCGIIGAFIGGYTVLKVGFDDGFNNRAPDPDRLIEIMTDAMSIHNPLMLGYMAIFTILSVTMIAMSYRLIKSQNL